MNEYFSFQFPRAKDTSFTGVTVEECRMLLETGEICKKWLTRENLNVYFNITVNVWSEINRGDNEFFYNAIVMKHLTV